MCRFERLVVPLCAYSLQSVLQFYRMRRTENFHRSTSVGLNSVFVLALAWVNHKHPNSSKGYADLLYIQILRRRFAGFKNQSSRRTYQDAGRGEMPVFLWDRITRVFTDWTSGVFLSSGSRVRFKGDVAQRGTHDAGTNATTTLDHANSLCSFRQHKCRRQPHASKKLVDKVLSR